MSSGDVSLLEINPKKRGRPSKSVHKSPSGRGLGRPAKNSGLQSTTNINNKSTSQGSDEEEEGSISKERKPIGRGRPPKLGRLKITHSIESTGRGRGRPKKVVQSPTVDKSDDEDDNDQSITNKAKKTRIGGRPKKKVIHDDISESDNDKDADDERRPIGRPATGAGNLNIVRTGRGQGRPKKQGVPTEKVSSNGGGELGAPRKRGRPPSGKSPKGDYIPTGAPRGRPRTKHESIEDEQSGDDEPSLGVSRKDVDDGNDLGVALDQEELSN